MTVGVDSVRVVYVDERRQCLGNVTLASSLSQIPNVPWVTLIPSSGSLGRGTTQDPTLKIPPISVVPRSFNSDN